MTISPSSIFELFRLPAIDFSIHAGIAERRLSAQLLPYLLLRRADSPVAEQRKLPGELPRKNRTNRTARADSAIGARNIDRYCA